MGAAGAAGEMGSAGAVGPTGPAGLADFSVFGACTGNDKVTGIDMTTGAVVCAADADTNTTYIAGNGLALAGTTFSADFAGSGSATTVSRSDHIHADSVYRPTLASFNGGVANPSVVRAYTEDLSTTGVVRCTSGTDQMVKIGNFWIDRYEAVLVNVGWWNGGLCDGMGITPVTYGGVAGGDDYPAGFPDTGHWTTAVYACSVSGVTPSASMTWFQAQQACESAGKRLCTNAEWQAAVAGTFDPGVNDGSGGGACNTEAAGPRNTGNAGLVPADPTACISRWGAEDMIGNLWEWAADWQGQDNATNTLLTNPSYGSDYMYDVSPAEVQGGGQNFPAAAFRGGDWTNDTGAGAGALLLGDAPSTLGATFGARCCAGGR